MHDHCSQVLLFCLDERGDVFIEQQIGQVWIFLKCRIEYFQHGGTYDASPAPDADHFGKGYVHFQFSGSFMQQREALCITNDHGEIKRIRELLDEYFSWNLDL